MNNKKELGRIGEELAIGYYEENGYEILDTNYTIPGGELDVIAQKDGTIVFVEVKVVEYVDDLMGYIKPQKLKFLGRTIEDYMYKKNLDFEVRLDVVFIKNNSILEVFENVTNS
ncbi:MAG: YraN family protein [Candidatus Absconditabacterales bacterium]|nr:YraN family protein [Candidatus Absconditabacterales bacterium]